MRRRLPILITLLMCTSCWTFGRQTSEISDDAGPDAGPADMDVADVSNDANNTNNTDLDMNLPDGGDDAGADMDDLSDLPGDPDLGMVDQLIVTDAMCTDPATHESLSDQGRMLTGSFGPEISLANFAGPAAWLSWTQSRSDRFVDLTITGDTVMRGDALDLSPDATDGNVLTTAVGTGDDLNPQLGIWSVSATRCTDNTIWWGGVGGMLINSISYDPMQQPCPAPSPQLAPMEVGGGWNPFRQATSAVTRRFVYLSDEGIIGALAEGYELSNSTSSPATTSENPFLLTTKGRLAFYPNDVGRLMAWDTNQAHMNESDPIETPLTGVAALEIDVEVLDDAQDRYVVARVVGGDAIMLELWEYTLADEFVIVGEWLELGGLTAPSGVELATFEGGFVLWYESEIGGNEQEWTVHPFMVNGDALVRYSCAYSHRYSNVTYIDNDLIAFRDEDDLQVRGAVLFSRDDMLDTQNINVEGPRFPGFPP